MRLFDAPARSGTLVGEARRHECLRCRGDLVATANEMWAKLDDDAGERWVCVSERAAVESGDARDVELAVEPLALTGYFVNCYGRHYKGELPARSKPRLDAERVSALPPWVVFKASKIELVPPAGDAGAAVGLLWARVCASLEIRRADDDYEPWIVDGWVIHANANTGAVVLEPVAPPRFDAQSFRNVYSRGALPLRCAPGGGFKVVEPTPRKAPVGGKWTEEEDRRLREIVETFGAKNWKRLAMLLGTVRSDVQCLHRWNKVLRPGLSKGPWAAVWKPTGESASQTQLRRRRRVDGVKRLEFEIHTGGRRPRTASSATWCCATARGTSSGA